MNCKNNSDETDNPRSQIDGNIMIKRAHKKPSESQKNVQTKLGGKACRILRDVCFDRLVECTDKE